MKLDVVRSVHRAKKLFLGLFFSGLLAKVCVYFTVMWCKATLYISLGVFERMHFIGIKQNVGQSIAGNIRKKILHNCYSHLTDLFFWKLKMIKTSVSSDISSVLQVLKKFYADNPVVFSSFSVWRPWWVCCQILQ